MKRNITRIRLMLSAILLISVLLTSCVERVVDLGGIERSYINNEITGVLKEKTYSFGNKTKDYIFVVEQHYSVFYISVSYNDYASAFVGDTITFKTKDIVFEYNRN